MGEEEETERAQSPSVNKENGNRKNKMQGAKITQGGAITRNPTTETETEATSEAEDDAQATKTGARRIQEPPTRQHVEKTG